MKISRNFQRRFMNKTSKFIKMITLVKDEDSTKKFLKSYNLIKYKIKLYKLIL